MSSYKSFLIIILSCSVILIFRYIWDKAQDSARQYICSGEGYHESIIQIEEMTILMSPQHIKPVLECAGKAMPFYDRTIEILVGEVSSSIQNELNKRYIIKQYLPNKAIDIKTLPIKEVILY